MKIRAWEEVVGVLESIKEESEESILTLDGVGDIVIKNNKQLTPKLKKAVGQRIGILRTDIQGREYVLRKLT